MAAYLVAVCQVTDPNDNFKKYAAESARLMHAHGGEYIVRGPAAEILKGDALKGKVVIITEFSDMAALQGFINDAEYVNEIAPLREGTGIYDFACYESAPPMPGS
jgi:uncharacterized protein (DUF1330 family)